MSHRKALVFLSICSLFAAGALLSSGQRAESAFPGANGKIAFRTDRDGNQEIYVMNSDGSGQTNITQNPLNDRRPKWSPDWTRIAYHTEQDSNLRVYIMNAYGESQTPITAEATTHAGDGYPAWSPDKTKIVFHSARDGNLEIYVMDPDGMNPERLTMNTVLDEVPEWSPDGSKITFARRPDDGNEDVWVMNANDGSGQSQLTFALGHDCCGVWSPDGSQLVFVSNRDGNQEVYKMDADGDNQTRLTFNGAQEGDPSWSPDGNKIVFSTDRDGNQEIYVMNTDGSGQKRLTYNEATDADPVWRPLVDSDSDGLDDFDEHFGVPAAKGGPYVTDPLDADSDDDGCTDGREVGPDQAQGGRRNPTNFWDYADMPIQEPPGSGIYVRNKMVLVNDILAVIRRYFTDDDGGTALVNRNTNPLSNPTDKTSYHPAFDRTYEGPNQWNLGPPDGLIRINDILAVVYQAFHDCA